MKNLIIRNADLKDLEIIQKLNNELFDLELKNYDTTLVKDWAISNEGKKYFEDLINNHFVVVALLDDEIVGYLAGTINEKGSYENIQYGEINNMFIKDSYRGYGVGKALVNEFKMYCKSKGINDLIVTASAKNKNAINFYKKNGFEEFNLTLTMNIEEENK